MKAPPVEWLLKAASIRATDVAIHFGDETWTYAQLADHSLRTATVFKQHGIRSGSRVALVSGMGRGYIMSLLGSMTLGAAAVPINPLYRSTELAFHLRSNAVVAVVTDPANAKACAEAMKEAGQFGPVLTFGTSDMGTNITPLVEAATPSSAEEVQAEEVAVVLHTAGSTGRSKLVPRTYGQVRAECDSVFETIHTSPDDVIFGMLPLYHCHGC